MRRDRSFANSQRAIVRSLQWNRIMLRLRWGRRILLVLKKRTPPESTLAGSFVIPLGFEPKTHSLEGCCSIQLSYGTDLYQTFYGLRMQKYGFVLRLQIYCLLF